MTRRVLFGGLLLAVFGSANPAWADVTVDAASSTSTSAVAASSLTWTHTVGASLDRHLLVGVSINLVGGRKSVTSVTCGANGLSLVGARDSTGEAPQSRIEIWSLASPPSGACTMTVQLSAAAQFVAGAVSFFGVDLVTPLGPFVSAGATAVPSTLTLSSATGEVVFDTVAIRGDTTADPVVGAAQAQAWLIRTSNSTSGDWGGASTEPGAASVTMSWDGWSPNRHWALGSIAIKAEPNTPTPTPTMTPTLTPTSTPTSTPTFTPTPTTTPTLTPTPTVTPTETPTITPTITPTLTSTITPTITPTLTSTATPTSAETPTLTPTATTTFTPASTVTPTATPTSTVGNPAASDVPLLDSGTLALLALALVWLGLRALQGNPESP